MHTELFSFELSNVNYQFEMTECQSFSLYFKCITLALNQYQWDNQIESVKSTLDCPGFSEKIGTDTGKKREMLYSIAKHDKGLYECLIVRAYRIPSHIYAKSRQDKKVSVSHRPSSDVNTQ